jgi:hypothetical protein
MSRTPSKRPAAEAAAPPKMDSSATGGLGILAVDDLPHLWAAMAASEKAPKLVALAA